jgi:hypothetical protein
MIGRLTSEQCKRSEDDALPSFGLDMTIQEVAERFGISEENAFAIVAASLKSTLD